MNAPVQILNALSPVSMSMLPSFLRLWTHWGRLWQRLHIYEDVREQGLALGGGIALNFVGGQMPLVRLAARCVQLMREILRALNIKDALYHQSRAWIKALSGRTPSEQTLSLSNTREFSWLSPSLSLNLEGIRTRFEGWALRVIMLTYRLVLNALRLSASLLEISDIFRERSEAEIQDTVNLTFVNANAVVEELSKRGTHLIKEEFQSRKELITFILNRLGLAPTEQHVTCVEKHMEQAIEQKQDLVVGGTDAASRYVVPVGPLKRGARVLLYTFAGQGGDPELFAG